MRSELTWQSFWTLPLLGAPLWVGSLDASLSRSLGLVYGFGVVFGYDLIESTLRSDNWIVSLARPLWHDPNVP